MKNNLLGLKNVSFNYDDTEIFNDLNFEVAEGELVAVIGPSGCGKTTLLNLIAGAVKPSDGEIFCNGNLRMVYQQSSLFPWLKVEENIALGLGENTNGNVTKMLETIGLKKFATHFPHQLSGGMKQRVELGRALISESEILLLDEPFSSLDYLTKLNLRTELVRMLKEFPRTTIIVTHDIEEATQLADRVVILSGNPASIKKEFRLESKKPRNLTDTEVIETVHKIFGEMKLFDYNLDDSEKNYNEMK